MKFDNISVHLTIAENNLIDPVIRALAYMHIKKLCDEKIEPLMRLVINSLEAKND